MIDTRLFFLCHVYNSWSLLVNTEVGLARPARENPCTGAATCTAALDKPDLTVSCALYHTRGLQPSLTFRHPRPWHLPLPLWPDMKVKLFQIDEKDFTRKLWVKNNDTAKCIVQLYSIVPWWYILYLTGDVSECKSVQDHCTQPTETKNFMKKPLAKIF